MAIDSVFILIYSAFIIFPLDLKTLNQLHAEGLISDESLQKSEAAEKASLFSLHWELKTLLYLGITLLSGGLGILVYKNIETIGHQAVLVFIALVCLGSFYYCRRKASPFSVNRVPPPDPFFDYVLLLGCLTLITFIAYLQYAYTVFGNRYGLATFIPMIILFLSAYSFDHLGILSLAITNLAAWMGIAITPMRVLETGRFEEVNLVYTGLALGAMLFFAAWLSEKKNIKQHFAFTYRNFGIHILFMSGLAGMFMSERLYFSWFLLLLGIAWFVYRQAMKNQSFYFFLLVALYTYIALSYVVTSSLDIIRVGGGIYLAIIYFIASAIGLVRILMIVNHKMKSA